ncbi:carboxymuconolactone decarboxylase family protein [Actinoplanes sp. NBC_00393]|uniref:carboxymuconolactone decarboxylase family protein n=1 Tax=Actinoplanes sp. NBC_00393 TaxID=2975953 RepID=UPI002E22E9D7
MLRNPNHTRVPLVSPPHDDDTAAALEKLGPPLALFRAFAVRPARAHAIHGWGSYYLSRRSALSLRQRELVIDRTTALCGAEYEWGIHIAVFASKAGLTSDQVRSLTAGAATDTCWTDPADRAVIAAVDALHARNDLDDLEWAALAEAVGPDGAVDLMLVCGWYHAISYVARAARLAPEPGSPAFSEYGR